MKRYWLALGALVHAFAQIEKVVYATVIRLAKVPRPVGQAMLSGQNLDQLCAILKRVVVAHKHGKAIKSDIDDIVSQLGIITRARNDILHFGTTFREGAMHPVSNIHKEYIPERMREISVSVDVLQQMATDLDRMLVHLIAYCTGLSRRDAAQFLLRDPPATSWQYKPSSPVLPHRRRHGKNPTPKRQR